MRREEQCVIRSEGRARGYGCRKALQEIGEEGFSRGGDGRSEGGSEMELGGDGEACEASVLSRNIQGCNLAWLLADYFASFVSRKATGAITCGSFITRIARRIGRFSTDIRDSMTVTYASTLLGRSTVMLMGIAAEFPRVGLRWSLDRRTEWVPPVPAPQQQPGARPHVQEPPADHQDPADQPPPPPHHVVVRQPRLHPADATILRDLIGSVRDLSGRVDRLEGMMRWMMERMAATAGMDVPVFPGPGYHQDPSRILVGAQLSVEVEHNGATDLRRRSPQGKERTEGRSKYITHRPGMK
ncbi:hypothetical protein E3N88_42295 [Mikania micrantha]|uniref:Uncharacterized protein n=1 Tax=Mikania micrantha TaxID=192012 RepID=A0A5N6LKE0_9ASTR|nr:hypothetical protein E3N88_42295 [Mikania micrantha]